MEKDIGTYCEEKNLCDVCGRTNGIDDSFWDGTTEYQYPIRCENGCSITCECGNVCDGVELGCIETQHFKYFVSHAWTFDITCGECNSDMRHAYCAICKEHSWEELCCKCSDKVAKELISCWWNDCNCHSFIAMSDFAVENELYAMVLNINKKDGWSVICCDHGAFHGLRGYNRGKTFTKSPIWYIDMRDKNWIWDIIAEYYNTIDELYHKMSLVNELCSLLIIDDIKFLINHMMVDQTLIEIIDTGC